MKNEELDYKDLAVKLLEGACKITLELFDLKKECGKMKLELPAEFQKSDALKYELRNMWVAWYISEQSEIKQEILTKLAKITEQ